MKKIAFFLSILIISAITCVSHAQDVIKQRLISQGAWFLFSLRTDENFNDSETLTQVDFFKKDDVSSILFDNDDKVYSVFSKDGADVWEDLWRMVDDTHFVMVSPQDSSNQLMNIIELNAKTLVIRSCSDIEDGSRCLTYTYFSTKDGWLPNEEIEELNSAGVIEMNEMAGSILLQ